MRPATGFRSYVLVLMVQLFQKFPGLIVIAPTQKAPAFVVTQVLVLLVFLALGRAALRGFAAVPAAALP